MSQKSSIIFVCEHGAAKSILAAAYFNKLASEMGLDLRALARGTHPDEELSSKVITGLANDGLHPTQPAPQKLTQTEIQKAQRIIAFCQLPIEYQRHAVVEQWDGIPPVSDDYEKARDAIIARIRQFLNR